jgi:hypothetical protein
MSSGTGVERWSKHGIGPKYYRLGLQAKLRRPGGGGGCVLNWNCVETAIDFKRRFSLFGSWRAIGSG